MQAPRTRRAHIIAIAMLVIAATGTTSTAAHADSRDSAGAARHWHLITGSSHIVVGAPNCDTANPPACVYSFTNQSIWDGDVTATQVQSGALVLPDPASPPTAAVGTATSWITGTVVGCPTPGRFALAWHANGLTGTADVINDTGSDGLATIHGSFHYETTYSAAGIPSTEYTGKLRCDHH